VILYLAGSTSPGQLELAANRAGANNFLFSFADVQAQKCAKRFCVQLQRRIFIDSGAYSVWASRRKRTKIKLGEYIAFCKQIMGMRNCPVVFAALDVIPGKKSDCPDDPTADEIKRACDDGWANYMAMKQAGISPCLMTFHQFEPIRQLTRIVDDSDYFAVSPRKCGVSDKEKLEWLDGIFRNFGPPRKIHGLGVFSKDLMERFPFFSVDNTGWVQSGKFNLRFHISGGRPVAWKLKQWKRLAREHGMPTLHLAEMLGYGPRGPQDSSGYPWLWYLAMDALLETEQCVTQFWRNKGVVWDEQEHETTDIRAYFRERSAKINAELRTAAERDEESREKG